MRQSNKPEQRSKTRLSKDPDINDLIIKNTALIFQCMDDLVFIIDKDRIFRKCFQPESQNLFIPFASFINKHLTEIPFPPELLEKMTTAIDLAEKKDLPQTINYNLHINDELKWFNSKISNIPEIGFIIVVRDVTEQRKSIDLLEANEKKYHLLADNILDLVGLHDVTGVFEYASPSAFTVLGYEPEELVGKNAFDLIHPDESKYLFDKTSNLFFKGVDTFIEEFRILHKKGHYVFFETTAKIIRDNNNEPIKFLTTSRDITEWKQAQFALKESEEKYRSLVEGADNLIIVLDKSHRYLFVNPAAAKVVGTTRENMVGKTIGEISKAPSAEFFKINAQICINEKRAFRVEHKIQINGLKYFLRTSFNPIRNAEGDVYAALVNAIDITNLKNTEALLEQQNKDLKEIAFLQSHVLRSPLSNIKHLISLLDKQSFSEENKILFDLIKTSTDNLDDVIRQIVEKTYLPGKKD